MMAAQEKKDITISTLDLTFKRDLKKMETYSSREAENMNFTSLSPPRQEHAPKH